MSRIDCPVVSLKEITEGIQYGYTTSADFINNGPYKFLRITDIQENNVDWDGVPFAEGLNDENEARKYLLQEGDIVFARTGGTTGKSYLISKVPSPTVFASYLIRVRPDKSLVTSEYLAYFFQTSMYWRQVEKNKKGAAQAGVNATVLGELKIPLLPIEEQKKITAVLSKAQTLIGKRKETITKLDELIQTVFVDMFGDFKENRFNWDIVSLDDVTKKITDGVHSKPEYTSEGIPFISVKDISSGTLIFDECKFISEEAHNIYTKRCKPEYGDILYTKVGARYGIPVCVDTNKDFSIYVSVALIKPNFQLINSIYLRESLKSIHVRRQADRSIKGIGVPDLHLIEIKKFEILLPPIVEQEKFAKKMEQIEIQKNLLEKSLSELEGNFQSLLQQAFKGELKVNTEITA
ncbi:restriction endonuclease subunit S [Bacillus toyonensis]|uniref:restriction endonuclease subunit S n=1 Tax=Bacillus toyonensis TaxID=155322 RepID=UPI00382990F0